MGDKPYELSGACHINYIFRGLGSMLKHPLQSEKKKTKQKQKTIYFVFPTMMEEAPFFIGFFFFFFGSGSIIFKPW